MAGEMQTTAILRGTQNSGSDVPVPVTGEGHLEVAVHSPLLPFGSLHTEAMFPIFQSDAVYGINTSEVVQTTSGTGEATASASLFICRTGATVGSVAALQSRKRLRYRAGQGVIGRFTAMFSTPLAGSYLVAGLGTAEAGFYFGYNGTSFGILHSTGGVREIQTLTVTTASTATNNYVVTLNGTAHNVTATSNSSTVLTAYEISKGTYPGWTAEQRGSTVIFVAGAAGNKTGEFSLAQTGAGTPAAGSFAETLAGVSSSDNWIPQSSWNGDKLDGTGPSRVTLDPQKLNVFEIDIQYLGAGVVEMKVEVIPSNGNNGEFVPVHTFAFPNTRTTPTISQPSFPFTMSATSVSSSSDVSVKGASFAGFIEGQRRFTGPRMTYAHTSTAVTTGGYYCLATIRNNRTYRGRANQAIVHLLSFGGAIEDTTPVTLYLIKNATLVGTPNFAAWSTNSCTDVDTAATTCTISTNEQILFSLPLGQSGSSLFAFTDEVTLQPGETVTIAATAVFGTTTYTITTLNTREDQ